MAKEKIIVSISSRTVICERCDTELAPYLTIECNEQGKDAQASSTCFRCMTEVEKNVLVGIVSAADPIKYMTEDQLAEYWEQKQQAHAAEATQPAEEQTLKASDIIGDLSVEVVDDSTSAGSDLDLAEDALDLDEEPLATGELEPVAMTDRTVTLEESLATLDIEDALDVEEATAYTYEQLLAKVTSALATDETGRFYHLVMHMAEQVLNQRVTYDDDYEEFQVTAWDSVEDVVDDRVLA